MEIHCPLINQNLSAETDGTLKVCCDMLEIRDKSTGLFISRDSHTPNQAFNSLEFNSIRENFNLGIKDPHCKKCWDDESNGVTSRRMFEIEQDGHKPSVGLKSMTLSLGNTCNIKCRTCGSRDSTTWLKEEYDLKADYSISFKDFRKQNTIKLKNDSKFYRSFIDETLPNLDELGCLGGEPFMLKDFWNLLEIIIEKKLEKKITLTVSTNCTFWPDKKVELLSQFSNLNIACSIDGLGQRFNYMRHPADWAEVSKNLDSMIKWKNESRGRNLVILPAVSSFNVWYLEEIEEYAKHQGLDCVFRTVVTPDSMDIIHIPIDIRQQLINRLPENIRNHITSAPPNPEKWQEFLNLVKTHDTYRSESFSKVFQEYCGIIGFE